MHNLYLQFSLGFGKILKTKCIFFSIIMDTSELEWYKKVYGKHLFHRAHFRLDTELVAKINACRVLNHENAKSLTWDFPMMNFFIISKTKFIRSDIYKVINLISQWIIKKQSLNNSSITLANLVMQKLNDSMENYRRR